MVRVGAFITAFLLGVTIASSASAVAFDRTGARNYAHAWSSNTDTNLRSTAYQYFSNDCANFVSQVLYQGGGLPMTSQSASNQWWYNFNPASNTTSWSVAKALKEYLVTSGRATIYRPGMTDRYTAAASGDVYVYEWGDGDGWDHVSASSGYGDFADYTDPSTGKRYRSVTSGSGDFMSQHTRHRDYAPWNWGYWAQSDPVVRSRMDTILLHINT